MTVFKYDIVRKTRISIIRTTRGAVPYAPVRYYKCTYLPKTMGLIMTKCCELTFPTDFPDLASDALSTYIYISYYYNIMTIIFLLEFLCTGNALDINTYIIPTVVECRSKLVGISKII